MTDIRQQVLSNNLLGKKTLPTREDIWKNVKLRYLTGRDEAKVQVLAKFVASAASSQARHLVLLYTFAQADNLLYDFTADFLYNTYHLSKTEVKKADVLDWFNMKSNNGHVEISKWSPQTLNKLVSHLLSITRDFGLLEGVQHKRFHHMYVPLSAFLYLLYDQYAMGINGKQLIESKSFRLFLLDQDDVLLLLNEAASQGFVTLRHTANLYDLNLHYKSLEEVVNRVIAAQIS